MVRPAPARRAQRLRAQVEGAGDTAVLLLHGQPGTRADWQWVTPLLRSRYLVAAADRPGYGQTGGPATGFAGNALAVVGLLDDLGLSTAILVGHSWAGGAALATACFHPDRVKGLVLVSSVGPGEVMAWDDRLLGAPLIGDALSAAVAGGLGLVVGSEAVRRFADRRLPGRARDAIVALARLTGRSAESAPESAPEPVWRSFVAEQRALLSELDGLGRHLGSIAAPTTIVHGEVDRQVRASVASDLQAAIPGATLRVIAGAGHLLPHDNPEAIQAAVEEVNSRAQR